VVAAVGIAHATAAAQAQGLRLLRLLGRIPFGQFGHTEQELLQKIEDEMVSFGPGGSVLHHLLWPARKHLLRITSTPACPACGHLARPHTQIDELPPRIFISEPEIRAASGNPFAALLSQLNNVHVQAHQRTNANAPRVPSATSLSCGFTRASPRAARRRSSHSSCPTFRRTR